MCIYLDNNATTRIHSEVLKILEEDLRTIYGNPSTSYTLGQKSKNIIERSREGISELIGCKKKEIIFTSGGSEGNNYIIKGIASALKSRGNHIVSTSIEHSSVKNTLLYLEKHGYRITFVDPDKDGVVSESDILNAIEKDTILVSIHHSNNEIGSLQRIDEIGDICKKKNIYFHVDGVQSLGKVEVTPLNCNAMTFSGHKFGAPKGVGFVYLKSGTKIDKLIHGGEQERNNRSGTENTPFIHSLFIALEKRLMIFREEMERERTLRDYLEEEIVKKVEVSSINGKNTKRLPNTSSITFKNLSADVVILSLDRKGICVGAGSACASMALKPSHVLERIGLSKKEMGSTIRVSLGVDTKKEDIDKLVEGLVEVEKLEKELDFY